MRDWLIEKRNNKNYTQKEISRLCSISQQRYSHYEKGIRNPQVKIAKKIAEVLEFEWSKFYE